MSTFCNTSFLCAYFSYDQHLNPNDILVNNGWEQVCFDNKAIEEYKQFYYPEFVDYSLTGSGNNGAKIYTRTIEAQIEVCKVPVLIKESKIYILPYGMALFSIRVEMKSETLNNFTLALFNMREKRRWSSPDLKEFCDHALESVKEAASLLGCRSGNIVEMGNKLKIFQIITAKERRQYPDNLDNTLFELGVLGKIGGCSENDPDSPSKTYIHQIIENNRLSFFNNWMGLALFDTFTIMGFSVTPWMEEAWITDYFSMIYIHNLFSKFYLFQLNSRFRLHPENGKELENEYNEFQRLYTFHKISYNFMPGQINKAMDRALEISEEKKLVADYISGYNKMKDDESSARLDRILTFLAIVTVFSTIWDFSSMLNAMWPFQDFALTVEAGFRIVVLLTLLAVILVIITIIRKPRR